MRKKLASTALKKSRPQKRKLWRRFYEQLVREMMLFSSLSGALPRANNDGTTFGTMRTSGERKAPFSSSPFSFKSSKRGGKGVARCCARFGRFRATTRCSNYGCGLFFNRVGSFSLKSKNHALSFSTSLSFYSTTTTSSSSSNTATAAFGSFPNRRRLSFISLSLIHI